MLVVFLQGMISEQLGLHACLCDNQHAERHPLWMCVIQHLR